LLLSILLFVLALGGFGQTEVYSYVDWGTGILHLEITGSTREIETNPASAATTTTRNLANTMATHMLNALLLVRVDSATLIRDLARRNPSLLRSLEAMAQEAQPKASRISRDLSRVTIPYELPLFPGLPSLLVNYTIPSPMTQVFQWQGGGTYSGLVIYAQEPLPVRGETTRGQQEFALLKPSLFLDLFDPNLNSIYESQMGLPEYLKIWGSAAYTDSFDETPFIERIGTKPLRVTASELFGIHPTDLILTEQIRDLLLYNEENRKILREGRILVILTPSALQEELTQISRE